jgi:hypothetical protein
MIQQASELNVYGTIVSRGYADEVSILGQKPA